MCGRFSLIDDLATLQETFRFEFGEEMVPRYNISPGQEILIIGKHEGKRVGAMMRWGLVPFWAKDPKIGYKMINARSEGIDKKPSFKNAFKKRRVLIPCSRFYEWKQSDEGKLPYRFIMKGEKPFAFAGIWETWTKGKSPLHSCSILTTQPNRVTKSVHDRMPVILHEKDYDIWMEPEYNDISTLMELLVPYEKEGMDTYRVSTLVNSSRNDFAEMISPLNSL
ncbi:SOS response-associated peptidase [Mesobacillus foraminis]|uniref:SOS response-associated peptidase n=1 Tax=Mesobacillus foraminis TaxID=279826 RepID=UPI001BE66436|nr:SOS response-associated peptidase [Mesobacillus foraminis]MBT2757786.1 SOS response-associated peptidase [Mesobacillus foraminis]